LSDSESEAAWDKRLINCMAKAGEGDDLESILWKELTAQVCFISHEEIGWQMFSSFCIRVAHVQANAKNKNSFKWKRGLQHAVFACAYPRLDIEVSKKMNHLLKVRSMCNLRFAPQGVCMRSCLYARMLTADEQHLWRVQAPFCVHPKTGKICVPISVDEAAAFDPDKVPTLQDLVAFDKGNGGKVCIHVNPCKIPFEKFW
jgi:hypothetical protein